MSVRQENGYYVWTKGTKEQLSNHFWTYEFECDCDVCVEQRISIELVVKLERCRVRGGVPIDVTSGYRCEMAQQQLRSLGFETTKGISQHELGNAADVTCHDMKHLMPLLEEYFSAIGDGGKWAHVDIRNDKNRRWAYNKRAG